MRSGIKKRTSKCWKRKLCASLSSSVNRHTVASDFPVQRINYLAVYAAKALVIQNWWWQSLALMKVSTILCAISAFAFCIASAQTPAPDGTKSDQAAQLEALAKKIDEQNAKIDALSQEILKLEQQLSHVRPGVMIGEGAPTPASAAPSLSTSHPATAGNTHTVARGETLTSIAKMYKVTVDDLENANHIEDGRKLQAGQTIVIPTLSPAASASSTPSP
jgi:LysM repeat protein